MKMKLLAAGVLLAGQGAFAADEGLRTAVLVDQRFDTVHQISARPLELVYADMSAQMPGMGAIPSSGNILADAVGFAIAGALVNAGADEAAQTRVDERLQDLNHEIGNDGMQPLLRGAFSDAFADVGLDQHAFAFVGGSQLDPEIFERIAAARGSERFVFVRAGRLGNGAFPMPVAMHDTQRQLRVALEIEVRGGTVKRNTRLSRRDVTWFSDALPVSADRRSLDLWIDDDLARLRAEVDRAIAGAVALTTQDREPPEVAKDAVIGVVGEVGLEEFNGVVLENIDGRALIWTRDGSLVSIPCQRIVAGDELVAARSVEEQRRAESVPQAGIADKTDGGKTSRTFADKAALADAAETTAADIAPIATESNAAETEVPAETIPASTAESDDGP
jgi:hypothetical protein